MGASAPGPFALLNGRWRDPGMYLLVFLAFGLGGGGGWLVAADTSPRGGRSREVALVRQQLEAHTHRAGIHTDGERLRAIVQAEIDRSLRPIERELNEMRATLHRLDAKLDRTMARRVRDDGGGGA